MGGVVGGPDVFYVFFYVDNVKEELEKVKKKAEEMIDAGRLKLEAYEIRRQEDGRVRMILVLRADKSHM
ncbi:MAG: hypothetical protein ACTSXX_13375 [Candidatus Baldrarchaeia archaeon]